MGAQRFAEQYDIKTLPINIGFTAAYAGYSNLIRASMGCKINIDGSLEDGNATEGFDMMMGYLKAHVSLKSSDRVLVLPFLDHGQIVGDKEILNDPRRIEQLAVVMIDNSYYPFDENIEKTKEYVERFCDKVLIEAQVDRIYTKQQAIELSITRDKMITTVEDAARYVKETGVDFIVPNLGTEHRVTSEKEYLKRYERQRAREIAKAIGKRICLHGVSSLGKEITTLAEDGILKVNVFTRVTVESGNRLYHVLKENEEGILKDRKLHLNSPAFRNYVHREKVADIIIEYLEALNYNALTER